MDNLTGTAFRADRQNGWSCICGIIVLQQKLTNAFSTGTGHSYILRVNTIVIPKSSM